MARELLPPVYLSYPAGALISAKDTSELFPVRRNNLFPDGYKSRRDIPALPFSIYNNQVTKPLKIKYITNPVDIGDHIYKRRYELKLSQSEVAKIINVSTDTITFWENKRSIPQIQFRKRIIEFLGYNPYEFEIMTFGDRIRHYRYLNGLSLRRLGKLLSVDPSIIVDWENNSSQPQRRIEKIILKVIDLGDCK